MDRKYGGFWARFAASIIDSLWLTPLTWGPIFIVAMNELMDPDGLAYLWFYTFFLFIVPVLVPALLWYRFQTTPGKKVLGLQVVDAKTLRGASLGKCLLRCIGYYVAMIPLFLGYVWVGIDKRKRGLHDYMGGTVVVYGSKEPEGETTGI